MLQVHPIQRSAPGARYLIAVVAALLGACAPPAPLMRPPPADLLVILAPPAPVVVEVEPGEVDPMADVQGDRPLPAVAGAIERIDCMVGTEDLQARMAMEAHGGQIVSFAYYSKWRPRTCSLDMQRDTPFTKWRQTADGATRVQTPHGSFLIRALADAYEFEFLDVERQKFCGMDGYTNGKMTIRRRSAPPECSVAGLLDRDDLVEDTAVARTPPVVSGEAAPHK